MLCSMLCMSIPLAGGRWLVMAASGRFRARMGAPYQSLPCHLTKPKTMWSCMCFTLPNLTGSCARGAKPIGQFGLVMDPLPMLTKAPFWLCRHSLVLLPIITGRGVKYTHNDIKHTVLHPDSGPTGIRLIPQERHQSLEVDTPHTIRRVHRVKVRRSSPHDHSERQRLPRYCVRSNIIW